MMHSKALEPLLSRLPRPLLMGLTAVASVLCLTPCRAGSDAAGSTQLRMEQLVPGASAADRGSRLVLETSSTGTTSLSLRLATVPESNGFFTRRTVFNLLVSAADAETPSTFGEGWMWSDAPKTSSGQGGMGSMLDQFLSGKPKPFKAHPMGDTRWRLKPCSSYDGGVGVAVSLKF